MFQDDDIDLNIMYYNNTINLMSLLIPSYKRDQSITASGISNYKTPSEVD